MDNTNSASAQPENNEQLAQLLVQQIQNKTAEDARKAKVATRFFGWGTAAIGAITAGLVYGAAVTTGIPALALAAGAGASAIIGAFSGFIALRAAHKTQNEEKIGAELTRNFAGNPQFQQGMAQMMDGVDQTMDEKGAVKEWAKQMRQPETPAQTQR